MSVQKNDTPQPDNKQYKYLDLVSSSISKTELKNNWSPSIETELIAELKLCTKRVKKLDIREHKYLGLMISIFSLLSIGLCVQANSIAQALREIARFSVEETIRINNQ